MSNHFMVDAIICMALMEAVSTREAREGIAAEFLSMANDSWSDSGFSRLSEAITRLRAAETRPTSQIELSFLNTAAYLYYLSEDGGGLRLCTIQPQSGKRAYFAQ